MTNETKTTAGAINMEIAAEIARITMPAFDANHRAGQKYDALLKAYRAAGGDRPEIEFGETLFAMVEQGIARRDRYYKDADHVYHILPNAWADYRSARMIAEPEADLAGFGLAFQDAIAQIEFLVGETAGNDISWDIAERRIDRILKLAKDAEEAVKGAQIAQARMETIKAMS